MLYFCTYFDSNYLIKGLALYRSLVHHAKPFHLWVLCFDDITYKILQELKLPSLEPILLNDFESGDKEIIKAKANRSRVEYYFTCTPSLPLYIFKNYPKVDLITYLDADLFFFSDPAPIYQELDSGSILVVGHRHPEYLRYKELYGGTYNVGFISFKKNDIALRCLELWRNQCLEWCYDRIEDGRFADQKYLDCWPIHFKGIVVLQHKGAGLAPWNLENYFFCLKNNLVLVDSRPLIFFHFAALKQIRQWLYEPESSYVRHNNFLIIKRHIYTPYIIELRKVQHCLSTYQSANKRYNFVGSIRNSKSTVTVTTNELNRIVKKIKLGFSIFDDISKGKLLLIIGNRCI